MRLGDFIVANLQSILAEWEVFARSIWPSARVDPAELRDHAQEILLAIARDMESPETSGERAAKSKGLRDEGHSARPVLEAAASHALARAGAGFDVMSVIAEYRALRASVLHLWHKSGRSSDVRDLDDIARFNEAIDQSMTDGVRAFTERLSHSQQMFLGILGHDLRNPLSAITLIGKILAQAGHPDPELDKMVGQLPVTADAMRKLVDNLLDYAGAELTGALPISPAPMDLGPLCEEVCHEIQTANAACEIAFDRRGDLTGTWDRIRLRQVLANLLGNAVQHGGSRCQIHFWASDEGPEVKVLVHNNGPAIPPEELPTIFDPVRRGLRAGKRHGSVGLGLYITRAIIVEHGGTIDVSSSAKEGTTFTARLPRKHQPRNSGSAV